MVTDRAPPYRKSPIFDYIRVSPRDSSTHGRTTHQRKPLDAWRNSIRRTRVDRSIFFETSPSQCTPCWYPTLGDGLQRIPLPGGNAMCFGRHPYLERNKLGSMCMLGCRYFQVPSHSSNARLHLLGAVAGSPHRLSLRIGRPSQRIRTRVAHQR